MKIINIMDEELFQIALHFRNAIELTKQNRRFYDYKDRMNYFPRGCCDDSADLLGYYLEKNYGIYTKQGNGIYRDENPDNTTNHVWIEMTNGTVIDITVDQFSCFKECINGIYVGSRNWFYNELDRVKLEEHSNIVRDLRLWHDYQEIVKYLNEAG